MPSLFHRSTKGVAAPLQALAPQIGELSFDDWRE
jgi:hypothetical protein